jgi:hypothetical protein
MFAFVGYDSKSCVDPIPEWSNTLLLEGALSCLALYALLPLNGLTPGLFGAPQC